MLGWLRSPRGSAATVTAVATILAMLWFVPRLTQNGPRFFVPAGPAVDPASAPDAFSRAANRGPADAPAPDEPPTAGPVAAADARSAVPAALPVGSAPDGAVGTLAGPVPGATRDGAGPAPPAGEAASLAFDIVRVSPAGEAVVAGRSLPQAEVRLMDHDQVLAIATADAGGQFAILPPRLPEGDHYLTLQVRRADQTLATSAQGVAVSVARGGATPPMVALLKPDQPAQILSDGTAPAAAGTLATPAAALPVAIQSVAADAGGKFLASGVAKAGSQCRLYLNGAFLTDVTAAKDGRWSVRVEKGMRPGKYMVRADELDGVSGKVVHRAEVPFDYPAVAVAGRGQRQLMARTAPAVPAPAVPVPAARAASGATRPAGNPVALASADTGATASDAPSAATAVVADLQTARVVRGDSLWRISRKMLGHGVNYTEIYASNTAQIRDPALIYPGQVFVVPHRETR